MKQKTVQTDLYPLGRFFCVIIDYLCGLIAIICCRSRESP